MRLFHRSLKKEFGIAECISLTSRGKVLAETVNTTLNFDIFINSYQELIDVCRTLVKYKKCDFLKGSPSKDLKDIIETRPYAEIKFIDRYINAYGINALEPININSYKLSPMARAHVLELLTKSETKKENIEHTRHAFSTTNDCINCFMNNVAERTDVDSLFERATRFCFEYQKVSIGMIQRSFRIGFNRAARIVDLMGDVGIIEPECGTMPRRFIVNKDTLNSFFSWLDSFQKDSSYANINHYAPDSNRYTANMYGYDDMDGVSFENFCVTILESNGFQNISTTAGSGDQGIDIIAFKDGVKYGIQCKCYSADIGNKAVQEVFSGSRFYDCHVPVVLTNRYFTKGAQELAAKTNVLLWDRNKLNELIKNSI